MLGPGLPDWPGTAAVLARQLRRTSPRAHRTAAAGVLPPAERRRAGRVIKLALAVGAEAVAQRRRATVVSAAERI